MTATGRAAINAAKTRCSNGHAFTPENTLMKFSKRDECWYRACRRCNADRAAFTRRKERARDRIAKESTHAR